MTATLHSTLHSKSPRLSDALQGRRPHGGERCGLRRPRRGSRHTRARPTPARALHHVQPVCPQRSARARPRVDSSPPGSALLRGRSSPTRSVHPTQPYPRDADCTAAKPTAAATSTDRCILCMYTCIRGGPACGPGSPELSKSNLDMASKLFTFTFIFTYAIPTLAQNAQYSTVNSLRRLCSQLLSQHQQLPPFHR